MLRKKIIKISSVLVAVIIAFSCFILPCSADTVVSGITNLGNIDLSKILLQADWYDESGKRHYHTLNNITVEGFNGDGSLRLNCDIGEFKHNSTSYHSVVPSGCDFRVLLSWYGDEDNIYFSFPDFLVPNYNKYPSVYPGWGAMRSNCNVNSIYDNSVFHVLSGSNCINSCYPHSIECFFLPEISFSQFDFYVSLTDPTIVPPMEALFNELGQFFGYSLDNISSSFNNIIFHTPLLILLFAFSIVGFSFVLLYRFIKGY